MKKLIKPFLMMLFIVGVTSSSFGQQKKPITAADRSTKTTENLTEKLSLDAKQKEAVKAITLKNELELERIQKEMKQLKLEAKAIRKKGEQDIKAVLNEEQKKKWEAIKAEKKEEHQKKKTN